MISNSEEFFQKYKKIKFIAGGAYGKVFEI